MHDSGTSGTTWSKELGRPVNIVPFKNTADPRVTATAFKWSSP